MRRIIIEWQKECVVFSCVTTRECDVQVEMMVFRFSVSVSRADKRFQRANTYFIFLKCLHLCGRMFRLFGGQQVCTNSFTCAPISAHGIGNCCQSLDCVAQTHLNFPLNRLLACLQDKSINQYECVNEMCEK